MVARSIIEVLAALLPPCTTVPPVAHLSEARATQLADAHVRSQLHYDLAWFDRSKALYSRDKEVWIVRNQSKNSSGDTFDAQISDKTHETTVIIYCAPFGMASKPSNNAVQRTAAYPYA
jgi:hypothetical protein